MEIAQGIKIAICAIFVSLYAGLFIGMAVSGIRKESLYGFALVEFTRHLAYALSAPVIALTLVLFKEKYRKSSTSGSQYVLLIAISPFIGFKFFLDEVPQIHGTVISKMRTAEGSKQLQIEENVSGLDIKLQGAKQRIAM